MERVKGELATEKQEEKIIGQNIQWQENIHKIEHIRKKKMKTVRF